MKRPAPDQSIRSQTRQPEPKEAQANQGQTKEAQTRDAAQEKRQLGQSLFELSILVPLLLLLTIGTVDFGRIMFAYVTIVNAANDGAQYAAGSLIKSNDTAGIVNAALKDKTSLLPGTPPTVTISAPSNDGQGEDLKDVTVGVYYTFTLLFPVPIFPTPKGLGNHFPIFHSATMRIVPD